MVTERFSGGKSGGCFLDILVVEKEKLFVGIIVELVVWPIEMFGFSVSVGVAVETGVWILMEDLNASIDSRLNSVFGFGRLRIFE